MAKIVGKKVLEEDRNMTFFAPKLHPLTGIPPPPFFVPEVNLRIKTLFGSFKVALSEKLAQNEKSIFDFTLNT